MYQDECDFKSKSKRSITMHKTSMFPTKATGIHFKQRGHSVSDVRITIFEKMRTSDEKKETDT